MNHTNIFVNRFFTKYFRHRAAKNEVVDWNDLEFEERKQVQLDTSLGFYEMDNLVHNLIHQLLTMGEDDPLKNKQIHHQGMAKHQEMIQSVKQAIKPGFFAVYFRPFTIEMIKDYLNDLKKLNLEAEQK